MPPARASVSPSPPPPAPPNASAAAQQGPAFTNLLPHAGHHADLQLINSMVNELCEVHASNRKAMDEMMARYEELRLSYEASVKQQQQQHHEQRVLLAPPVMQHDVSESAETSQTVSRADYEAVKDQLRQSQDQHKDLLGQYNELHITNTDYEDVMASMLMKVRDFSHAHTSTLIAWHRHYNTVIQNLRDESLQKSLEHSRWQESLGRLNSYVRGAFKSYCEESNPLYSKIAYLKRENKVMRSLLDWPQEELDSDDERETLEEGPEVARKQLEKASLSKEDKVTIPPF